MKSVEGVNMESSSNPNFIAVKKPKELARSSLLDGNLERMLSMIAFSIRSLANQIKGKQIKIFTKYFGIDTR